jgi:hypothetical protein
MTATPLNIGRLPVDPPPAWLATFGDAGDAVDESIRALVVLARHLLAAGRPSEARVAWNSAAAVFGVGEDLVRYLPGLGADDADG